MQLLPLLAACVCVSVPAKRRRWVSATSGRWRCFVEQACHHITLECNVRSWDPNAANQETRNSQLRFYWPDLTGTRARGAKWQNYLSKSSKRTIGNERPDQLCQTVTLIFKPGLRCASSTPGLGVCSEDWGTALSLPSQDNSTVEVLTCGPNWHRKGHWWIYVPVRSSFHLSFW